jgi:heptosyltransferase I
MVPKTPGIPASICILRLSAIGDVSHVLPTIHSIKQAWPETAISWIIGNLEYQAVKHIKGIEFIPFDKKKGWRALLDLRAQLRGRSFDVLLHMQVSLRASLASLAIKAPLRIGFDRKRARNLQWLFTNRQIAAVPRQHVLDSFLEFPRALGITPGAPRWNLALPAQQARRLSRKFDLPAAYAVINPCSSSRIRNYRNWSAENYARIIDLLAEKYQIATVLTGGPSDKEKQVAASICQLCTTEVHNHVGGTSLPELLAILQQAQLAIAPDTGPLHLANALGIPTIGLFATSNPLRTGPYSNQQLCVNAYPAAVQEEFGCAPDQLRWGTRVRNPEAMKRIEVVQVAAKIAQIALKGAAPESRA